MTQENFNELLHRLKVLHERELEGWQERVLELTNQKCCDTKRMEELFNKNQQLREQQRVLTENIKQLENRLRAGLCDRCTVTQDVAKRKQQEYESSQIQSLQHITVMASEMSTLRKENKRLQEEVKALRGKIEGQNGHSSQGPATEVGESPDPATTAMKSCKQSPTSGCTSGLPTAKSSADCHGSLTAEEKLPGYRLPQNWNMQDTYDVSSKVLANSSPISPGRRAETITSRGNLIERKRSHSTEAAESLHSPTSPLLIFKRLHQSAASPSSSSLSPSPAWDEKPVMYPSPGPVLYRPRPIKKARISFPWLHTDHQEWAALAPPTTFLDNNRKPVEKEWPLTEGSENNHQFKRRAPGLVPGCTVPHREGKTFTEERKDRGRDSNAASPQMKGGAGQAARSSEDSLADVAGDTPLDLSDPGRFKPANEPKGLKSSPPPKAEDTGTPEGNNKSAQIKTPPHTQASPHAAPSSAATASPPPSGLSVPTSPQPGQGQNVSGRDPQEQDEVSIKKEDDLDFQRLTNAEKKKVPVLTISLRPVVVLEALKHGLETRESCNQQIPMAVSKEQKQEEVLVGDPTSTATAQNGQEKRRGHAAGRDAAKEQRAKAPISQDTTDTV
ncbi:RBBP8 N-terminal-like protein isoform X2 [Brienomyrus brachyistius]|uniref:RBBP8 N-terminal-like protein isoform X2 n=1 Tax=Brienomyrus brachyistius TaxID=42636 RepID=UPI0020B199D0|nr:RBBP8 N-terminal-like protein isoform X2 [Brienomyrus brachyistius]XP_048873362.1 RBBP8 N-terminal-like protein isoform X2 [Brienomyrus brachyistius]